MNYILVLIFCVSFGNVIHRGNMAYLDIVDFFGIENNNLTNITWEHAVNNQTLLREALNSNAMMLEADVVMGTLNGTGTVMPIMAHPPANTSDLSLDMFLNEVLSFNGNDSSTRVKKGVKLDFKSIDALVDSTDKIAQLYQNMTYPVWINADIIEGPYNSTTTAVDAERFFSAAKQFTNSTLSIGWTTNYGTGFNGTAYTNEQINNMLNKITENKVNQSITFPVRAGIAAESISQMQALLSNVSGSTLTIWSSEGDPVNVTKLSALITTVGLDKTFIDVPDDLLKDLDLRNAGNVVTPVMKLLGTVVFIFILHLY